jgi:hypothetical protein
VALADGEAALADGEAALADGEAARAERHGRFDHGPPAERRAHLEVATEEARLFPHAEQAKVARAELVKLFGCKATSVLGHGKRQLVASQPDGHLQLACLGVAEGTELEFGREAGLLAGHFEPSDETGLLFYVGKNARGPAPPGLPSVAD